MHRMRTANMKVPRHVDLVLVGRRTALPGLPDDSLRARGGLAVDDGAVVREPRVHLVRVRVPVLAVLAVLELRVSGGHLARPNSAARTRRGPFPARPEVRPVGAAAAPPEGRPERGDEDGGVDDEAGDEAFAACPEGGGGAGFLHAGGWSDLTDAEGIMLL